MTLAMEGAPALTALQSPFARKLEAFVVLSSEERLALEKLHGRRKSFPAGRDMVHQGQINQSAYILASGWVCSYKLLSDGTRQIVDFQIPGVFVMRFQDTRDGKRQILSFYVPGDIPDLQTLHLPTMDHSVASVTPARLAMIPHAAIWDLCERNRLLAGALWRETLIDASIARTWVRCVGRLSAHARVAHILCELYTRLDAVGLAEEPIPMPITQSEFGDAMGLSVVQVNRTLRDLREAGLITVQRRQMRVHDLARLQQVADFNPIYLHLDPAER